MARNETIGEIQQNFANIYGFENQIIWDFLSAEQGDILKSKINSLIPNEEQNDRITELRIELFTQIWQQRKYTNRNSLSAIIYIFVTNENLENVEDSTEFSCHPVFRLPKCRNGDNDNSADCCMIFIDENARVYQNWKAYIEKNCLPIGKLVAPKDGIYTFDENERVRLEVHTTPAGTNGAQILSATDRTASVLGIGSCIAPIASIISLPVAAPLMAVSIGVGTIVGIYSAVRSASNLYDRSAHEQSCSITNGEARSSYITIMASTVGIGAARATSSITNAAQAGRQISNVTQYVANGMNITSILLSGSGVASGALDMILKWKSNEEISSLDALQLATSLLLVTHSVCNFRMANTIIRDAQSNVINSYRDNLSRRQRRMFDKLSKETIRIRGAQQGTSDIIRSVNDIPSKQYLNDLYKINKDLNRAKVRPAFASDGTGITLNNEVNVDPSVLRNNVQHNIGPNVLEQIQQPMPSTFNNMDSPNLNTYNQLLSNVSMENLDPRMELLLRNVSQRFVQRINDGESFTNILLTMVETFTEDMIHFIFNMALTFIDVYVLDIEIMINRYIPSEEIVHLIILKLGKDAKNYLQSSEAAIIEHLREYFKSWRTVDTNAAPIICNVCQGSYRITEL